MIDNGPAFRSHDFAQAFRALQVRRMRIFPCTPKTNGKVDCFIQYELREWAYGFIYRKSAQRSLMIHVWPHHYKWN